MTVNQSYRIENHFDRIIQDGIARGLMPGKTQEARDWYRAQAKKFRYGNEVTLMNSESAMLVAKPKIGHMYMYIYDAKYKNELPYWDACPVVFIVDKTENGWTALNLHYIHPQKRAKLLDALYNYTNNKKFDETTKLKLSYALLKEASGLKYFQPCFKRYLTSHLKSPFMEIPGSDWDICAFLPLANFQKAHGNYVYARSNDIING